MRYLARTFGALLITAAMACSNSSPTESSPPPGISGTYTATAFTTSEGGVSIDRLAAGLIMIIKLRSDGTTTGTITASGTTTPVAGTWDTTGTELHFHEDRATFLTEIPFHVQTRSLVADTVVGPTRYAIVLRKIGSAS
jgi:hypothetical protein